MVRPRSGYLGTTFGLPPGVPGGLTAMPGSTFGGVTVLSRLASGAGWMTPFGGTAESARLSGALGWFWVGAAGG